MYLPIDAWIEVKDGNYYARKLFKKHYSRYIYADGRDPKLLIGPGEKLLLINPACTAILAWRKFMSKNNQIGINCAIFRNESDQLSSELIVAAEKIAWAKWKNESRLYTYINSKKIKSTNPGYCFLMAGWKKCGITKKRKLIILEKSRRGVDD